MFLLLWLTNLASVLTSFESKPANASAFVLLGSCEINWKWIRNRAILNYFAAAKKELSKKYLWHVAQLDNSALVVVQWLHYICDYFFRLQCLWGFLMGVFRRFDLSPPKPWIGKTCIQLLLFFLLLCMPPLLFFYWCVRSVTKLHAFNVVNVFDSNVAIVFTYFIWEITKYLFNRFQQKYFNIYFNHLFLVSSFTTVVCKNLIFIWMCVWFETGRCGFFFFMLAVLYSNVTTQK